MAILKIPDDFYEPTYGLIAIHSYKEDYQIAYFLNVHLKTNLKRMPFSIELDNRFSFSLYEWEDIYKEVRWNLIANVSIDEQEINETKGLFKGTNTLVKNYLIPEYRKADYFLKIENGEMLDMKPIIEKINNIPQIATAYTVYTNKLKSKNNLIF
ncbi:IPExxxVDY family protein [Leptobacterium sp. I13]|uniref:IPExxxVDY family protein n=1 Tax=Leptobacterium meishanense TaxID=3128904 RepID=UPI0030EC8BC1